MDTFAFHSRIIGGENGLLPARGYFVMPVYVHVQPCNLALSRLLACVGRFCFFVSCTFGIALPSLRTTSCVCDVRTYIYGV